MRSSGASSDSSTPLDPLDEFLAKENELVHDPKQIMRLMEIGRKSGFRDLVYRKKIWPVLLQVANLEKLQDSSDFLEWNKSKEEHSVDYDQLKKDSMRSFHSLKPYQNIDQIFLKKKQDELLELLDAIGKNEPRYKYFQGFHDVVSIFISMFGMNTAYYMSHKLATTYLRDSFLYSFDQTVMILDKLIWQIVVTHDRDFLQIFKDFDHQRLGFTMPWIITWFAHTFDNIGIITRIWDYLISSKPSAIVYVSAALILNTKQKLLDFCQQSGCGCDLGVVHTFYQNIKDKEIDVEQVLKKATRLESGYPLESLEPSRQLDPNLVIREENFLKEFQNHDYAHRFAKKRKEERRKLFYSILGIGVVIAIVVWKKKGWGLFGVGQL